MLKKLVYKIARIDQRRVILDAYLYKNIKDGYAGGSLENSNSLIVTTSKIDNVFKDFLLQEQTILSEIILNENISVKSIEDNAKEILGPYEHIINYFEINACDSVQQLKDIYHAMQVESDYLVSMREGFISTLTVIMSIKDEKNNEVIESSKSLIKGLSEVLGRHGIIVNGIITEQNVDIIVVAKWTSLLSSKYGHILAGEIVHLSNDEEG